MKKIKVALVGAGNRGQAYCNYALSNPEELEVVAVVDVNPIILKTACDKYSVGNDFAFSDLDEFLAKKIECDFVINATMDEMHYETALKIINAGYDMLIEKPITPDFNELKEIYQASVKKNVKVLVCHVLRYTPFYRTIKSLIEGGEIGDIVSMEINEHVWCGHYLDSYVRGKWRSEKECGSPMLLAKCCHDTDVLCWLNNKTAPKTISSFGSRRLFVPENAPKDSTEFCYNCPHNDTCLYSAQKVHLEFDAMPFQTWRAMGKPWQEITKEEKAEFLKHDIYGKCAYKTDADIIDRQCVSVEFENGSIATHNLIAGTQKEDRWIHVVGNKGEIQGYISTSKITITKIDRSEGVYTPTEKVIDVSGEVVTNADYGGHAGGDFAIMFDLVRFFGENKSSLSLTKIEDSINGHLVVYGAEKSRKERRFVDISEFDFKK